ncbi:uncharacterized protein DUF4879 [Ureibacillus xyleni]|uniref:Uncharacterized protein DUF4879 n=1 Tax=Ureibacillus xyleni TaxID=614648 RepID=A0A285TQN5_9BACL|nr:DUF4879 domain-containing protein [Ureibacillus xyleni]SOC25340.1 uncharacterized protein DUF4879 [Ureibacillus xyleni]
MKKILSILSVVVLFISLAFLGTDKASAGPAPNLTKVTITAISGDGSTWESIGVNQVKANNPITSDTVYLKVRFTGYPQTYLAYSNGVNISSTKYSTVPVVSGGIVVGWDYYIKTDLSNLTANSITIVGIDQLGKFVYGNTINFDVE